MTRRQPTPEEDAEREAQGRALLEAIRQMREREAAQREWLRESIEAGYEARAADEEAERRRGGR
jgi:hypothetical protein